jgi:hypothetical protein
VYSNNNTAEEEWRKLRKRERRESNKKIREEAMIHDRSSSLDTSYLLERYIQVSDLK